MSYSTTNELNGIIDKKLPGRPTFKTRNLRIADETLTLYYRDTLQCIRAIYGDPQFTEHLILAPERHYTDHERDCRVYSEMYTGDWWWAVQVRKSFLRVVYDSYIIPEITRIASRGCYSDPSHHLLRQDSTHSLPWQGGIPSLFDNR